MKYRLFDRVVLRFDEEECLVTSALTITHEVIGTLLFTKDNYLWQVLLPNKSAYCNQITLEKAIAFNIDKSYVGQYYKSISQGYFGHLAPKQKCIICKNIRVRMLEKIYDRSFY